MPSFQFIVRTQATTEAHVTIINLLTVFSINGLLCIMMAIMEINQKYLYGLSLSDDEQMFPRRCLPPFKLSPVILGLQEMELLLDPVAGLGDGEL